MKLISLLFTAVAFSCFGQQTPAQLKGIEKELNQVLKDQQCAGFSVAVVKGNEVIYLQGFGYRDLEKKLPVTPSTLFAIGSSSKAFTAGLIGMLEEDGKLKLDDHVIRYLPELKIDDPTRASEITIRDMMCHRTGLPRYDYSWYLFNTASKDSLLSRLQFLKPTAGLREKWQYNNYMFLAQGIITEKITGTTWEENILKEYFMPMGMKRSTTSMNMFMHDSDASLPYVNGEDGAIQQTPYFDISGMGPAGSINSTASDLTNWLKVWINGGKLNGTQILPPAYHQQAIQSQMVISGGMPKDFSDVSFSNYGLGWMLHSYRGHYQVEHGGNIDGFSAGITFFPSDSIGIVVLSNQDGSPVPDIVTNLIADRLLGLEKRDWNGIAKKELDEMRAQMKAAEKEEDKNQVKNTTPSHELSAYEGSYYNAGYGMIDIVREGDSLRIQLGNYSARLKHYHYDQFEATKLKGQINNPIVGMPAAFETGTNGKISTLNVQFDASGNVAFKRTEKAVAMNEDEFKKYLGDYDLQGMTVTVSVKNNVLFVFVPGQRDYETKAVGNHTFNLTIADGYSVVFDVDTKGQVTALSFVQPNGTFKAKKK